MPGTTRDPERVVKQEDYDIAVIGGGIYGIMTAYEAVERGLKCILLERDDFGENTTSNWLRILHGGLRYLQSLDLKRFRESVSERTWFINTFPEHIQLLPCLMPLYNRGMRRSSVLWTALKINDVLSRKRNHRVEEPRLCLPNGKIIDPVAVQKIFTRVDRTSLSGGAVWYDAMVPDTHLLINELLARINSKSGLALNHAEVNGLLLKEPDHVRGVSVVDRCSNRNFQINAPIVVNAAGPWCRQLAADLDRDVPELFYPSIAWNILFDREALSDHALAVSPPHPSAHTYFLIPHNGKLLAGTGHRPWQGAIVKHPNPSDEQLNEFIADINACVPEVNLTEKDIKRVLAGYLPAKRPYTSKLANRPLLFDHGAQSHVHGLYSVSGVKFTTARRVAAVLLNVILERERKKAIDS